MFLENGLPTQSRIVMSADDYARALRTMIEHCVEDHGRDEAESAVNYALTRNNFAELESAV